MEIFNLFLPATNQFATDYSARKLNIDHYFHYGFHEQSDYKNRLEELYGRKFMRNELAEHISQFMKQFPSSNNVSKSIEKLKQENSVVVIGGQQAGILTGPLYTIHKIISIIRLAKDKEKELAVPVVPVFWIAGEDHDFDEVNHVFVHEDLKIVKRTYPEKVFDKRMVSDIPLNQDICKSWVHNLIHQLGETEHTKEILEVMDDCIKNSRTFVDFFAHLIMTMFKEQGLLIVDSGDKQLRKLEKEIFTRQINEATQITNLVKLQQKQLADYDFKQTIEISDQAANLFYYDVNENERILLEYDESLKQFSGKNGALKFSRDDLLEIAVEFPERLSNNVVTRPLSQEWLFPTLAFIAGPGEIAYWAELKKVFEHFQINMPPIVPRLNITFLERDVDTDLLDLSLQTDEVLARGVSKNRDEFLNSVKDTSLDEYFKQTKEQLVRNYSLIEAKTFEQFRGLVPLLKKNEALLLKQIEFMEGKVEEAIRLKHHVVLNKYTRVENAIKPNQSPQERIWNVLYYLNQYGIQFINELTEVPFSFDGSHKLVKL